ncbi:quinone oxidoreductase [uncultured Paludibaculum sp.]|uniref:quinone oxidoreductase family protein n=1 Tax=uncultured Paludibaculum sp. TaxID=1765020 RepID=UPI002AAA68DB|nr:quinone oxidoreductase [uncultured Paludibaculum sp.]
MKAVFVTEFGGVDKLRYEDLPVPEPTESQALVRIHAIGVNFIDIYFRTGLYPAPPPVILGMEAAGVVEAVAPDVTSVKPGDRVAFGTIRGSYAEYAAIPAWQLVPIPDEVDFQTAAGAMLQGMTAHYLTHSTYPLKPGDTCLVHAAAGGAGQWIVTAAKVRGARVIGTTSSAAKMEVAKKAGCDEVINYVEQEFDTEVRKLTDGHGVDVVYDSVGAATWERSLNSIKRRGMMVTFGNASGPVPPMAPLVLNQKGSLFLTRPKLGDYTVTREELEWRASDIFRWLADGTLKLNVHKVYPLADAGQAQTDLESRKTTGKLILVP